MPCLPVMMSLLRRHRKEVHHAVSMRHSAPVAHLPLVLGVLRKLEVAQLIDTLIPPNPAHVLSGGRGVKALVVALLDGHHALYKVGRRLDERGMVPLLQPGLERPSVHDTRLGQMLDALFAASQARLWRYGPDGLADLRLGCIRTPRRLPSMGPTTRVPTTLQPLVRPMGLGRARLLSQPADVHEPIIAIRGAWRRQALGLSIEPTHARARTPRVRAAARAWSKGEEAIERLHGFSRTLKVRGGIISQANRYLGSCCSSQRIFPPQIIQVLLFIPRQRMPRHQKGTTVEAGQQCRVRNEALI